MKGALGKEGARGCMRRGSTGGCPPTETSAQAQGVNEPLPGRGVILSTRLSLCLQDQLRGSPHREAPEAAACPFDLVSHTSATPCPPRAFVIPNYPRYALSPLGLGNAAPAV